MLFGLLLRDRSLLKSLNYLRKIFRSSERFLMELHQLAVVEPLSYQTEVF